MTISSDVSSPLVVVVGATGIQGGSVIHNLIASDKPYRLRGLTRDASKPAAQKIKELGVDIVSVNISVGNEAAVREAFRGATVVFSVTNFWEHMDVARETAEGKLMVDAAKAVDVKLFIFSGLPHVSKLSGGKYGNVQHFDGKGEIAEYARSQLPTVDVQAGYYMTNLTNPLVALTKVEDGSYLWERPTSGDPRFPYIDMEHDYGLFVRYAIESPEYNKGGGTIHTYGELVRTSEAAATLERVRGIKVAVTDFPGPEAQRAKLEGLGFPPHIVLDFLDSVVMAENGYYFGLELSEEQQKVRAGLARQPRTFEEFLRANPEFLKQ
ncbi:NAD(P)-binding protein [Exidia glandulosa HHB12029]|uniref:NAD(P)-binding protein n=1 Tax=Exidia glandulosa HHB12029 TaxID=1314781 RepID=A0A166MNI8_EXIGL|nr:NAD(P)-binding protein [Exidia glandulosa HHB12029]